MMEFHLLTVLVNDMVEVLDLIVQAVSSVGKISLLVGEISKLMIPSALLSVFPALVSGSGGSDLLLKSGDESGDLSEEFWVGRRRGDLRERLDKWLVSGEFVVKVGHVFESLGDALDSTLELDEKSTSAHGAKEINGILASRNTISMLLVEFRPSGVFHISLSLTGFDSADNRFELIFSLLELLFSISKKFLGVFLGSLRNTMGFLVKFSLVIILWDESITSSNGLSVSGVTDLLGFVKLHKESVDQFLDLIKSSLGRHGQRDLSKDGFSKWMGIDLENF